MNTMSMPTPHVADVLEHVLHIVGVHTERRFEFGKLCIYVTSIDGTGISNGDFNVYFKCKIHHQDLTDVDSPLKVFAIMIERRHDAGLYRTPEWIEDHRNRYRKKLYHKCFVAGLLKPEWYHWIAKAKWYEETPDTLLGQ